MSGERAVWFGSVAVGLIGVAVVILVMAISAVISPIR